MSRYVTPGWTAGGRFSRTASQTVSRLCLPGNSTVGLGTTSKVSSLARTVAVIETSADSTAASGVLLISGGNSARRAGAGGVGVLLALALRCAGTVTAQAKSARAAAAACKIIFLLTQTPRGPTEAAAQVSEQTGENF